MNNLFADIPNLLNGFQRFIQNPNQALSGMNLPMNAIQNPREAVQQLLNSGQMTQEQFNSYRDFLYNIRQTPMFGQMFGQHK